MITRYSADHIRFKNMDTQELRQTFLVDQLFEPDVLFLMYTDADRAIVGSVVPKTRMLELKGAKQLASNYFAERRELGIINIGGAGKIKADETSYDVGNRDVLYIGRGTKTIQFSSLSNQEPAEYYMLSYPAHMSYPTKLMTFKAAEASHLGSDEEANKRTIYKYIHADGAKSCQLVMGFTQLYPGSVWNTMPAHTHERRTEIYMYFDLPEGASVFHLLGTPEETRHMVIKNKQAVVSPSWSIHSGVGTQNYCFVWGMGGENQEFGDMDHLKIDDIQ